MGRRPTARISCGKPRFADARRYSRRGFIYVTHRMTKIIRKEQQATDAVISFGRMWTIIKDEIHPKRVTKDAVLALLEAVADLLPAIFRNAVIIAGNERRVTVLKRDFLLAYRLMTNPYAY